MPSSSELTYQTARQQLRPEKISPLYLIHGEERFFVNKLLAWFLENAIDPASSDFNYNRFNGATASPSEILYAAKTVPMTGGKKLVVIEDADQMKDPEGQLLEYIASPVSMATVILVAQKPDMRTKLFIALKKQAVVIHCRPPYENELPALMQQEGKQMGMTLSTDAIFFLAERLGKNLTLLHVALEKLSLYIGNQKEKLVSLEMVLVVVSEEKEYTVFDLVNAVFAKDLKNALSRLANLLDEGEAPLKILAMFLWQFRMMAIGKEALLSESESAVGKRLSLPPYRVGPFLERLRLWQANEIRAAFDLFTQTDLKLKGSRVAHAIILEDLILKICVQPMLIAERRVLPSAAPGRLTV
ncbi:MAG: DNA polymerase III subunit delta [Nitrospirota bacterium]